MHWNSTRYWGKGGKFYLESTVATAIDVYHPMNKAGIVPILQEQGKDVISKKNWQQNGVQGQV